MFYLIALIAVSLIPGLLWLSYFYLQDRYEPEPKGLILKVFFGGMLMVLPAGFLEMIWRTPLQEARLTGDLVLLFLYSFLMIGLIEEGVKMAFLTLVIYPHHELDEPVDGIVYGITVGLGFAVLENLFYTQALGFHVGLIRAVIGCLAHAAFTGTGAYYLSLAKKNNQPWLILKGLGVAVFWHGLYDFLLFTEQPVLAFIAFLSIGFLIVRLIEKMRVLVERSPFRN